MRRFPTVTTSGVEIRAADCALIPSVRVSDLPGRCVRERRFHPAETHLSLSAGDLSPGIYLLSIETPEGVETHKILRK